MQTEVKNDNLRKKFDHLAIELAIANTHLFFAQRMLKAQSGELSKPFLLSWDFWNYTINAHIQGSFMRLCRAYDTYKDKQNKGAEAEAFHLLRYVREIETYFLHSGELKDLHTADMQFLLQQSGAVTKRDEKVTVLRKWRNNVVAHSNEAFIINGPRNFFSKHQLDVEDLQYLIDKGFQIMERWAAYYGGKPPVQRLVEKANDEWSFVVELLSAGFDARKATIIR
jgi:hypothetical protein